MTNSDARIALSQFRAWAGETVFKRRQSYELRGRVHELATTAEGGLVAWVQGSVRYATRVILHADQLTSDCTCPYGGTCKHAIDNTGQLEAEVLGRIIAATAERGWCNRWDGDGHAPDYSQSSTVSSSCSTRAMPTPACGSARRSPAWPRASRSSSGHCRLVACA